MKLSQYIVLLIVSASFSGCRGQSHDKPVTDRNPTQKLADAKVQTQNPSTDKGHKESTKNQIINRAHYHTIEIKQMKFYPAELTVQKGDTVVWVNNDIVIHDVTEQSGKKWTSSPIPLSESWRMVVTQSSNYYCSIHVVMKGKLVVN